MENHIYFIFFVLLCYNTQLGFSKDQRYNPSSDFLLHEGGLTPNNKNAYASNFPSLPVPKSNVVSTEGTIINSLNTAKQQPSGKRDYVAPNPPTPKPTVATPSTPKVTPSTKSSSTSHAPKRDYVAPQFPTLKPVGTSRQPSSTITTPMPSTLPKRDYVNPKYESTQKTPGKVKDLINFYDSKSPSGLTTPRAPSYSSILSKNKDQVILIKPSTGSPPVITTATKKPVVINSNLPTNAIRNPTLPSALANNQGQGVNSYSKGPTDAELQVVSEELLRKDVNNAAKYITVNYQEKTTSFSKDDMAPSPLLTIAPDVWNILTVQKFLPLLDNYERDTLVNEYVTAQEKNEENAFMDAIMATSVIRHLMNFLKDKGYVSPDPKQQRDYLKQMWFGLYSRGKGKISSSGFEHVFVSELKNGEVSGLHNWVYFSKEEEANRINYLGYLKYSELSDKGAVIKMHFNQQGVDKPVDTMFIGTSPELEMAIYTLCYVTRVDNDCNIKLGNKDVNIITHNYRYRSKNFIGSAYPQI